MRRGGVSRKITKVQGLDCNCHIERPEEGVIEEVCAGANCMDPAFQIPNPTGLICSKISSNPLKITCKKKRNISAPVIKKSN